MQILVDNAPLDYQDSGDGAILVFLHGWGESRTTWEQLISVLKTEYRCIALDLPNFGSSAENPGIVTMHDYANAIAEFLRKMGINDYSLVGHSMGGQIAVYGTGQGLLRPVKLVLLASAGVRSVSSRKRTLATGAKLAGKFLPLAAKRAYYKRIGSDYDPKLSPVLKKVIHEALTTDVRAEAAMVAVPTLLCYGSADTATPPAYGKLLQAQIPSAEFVKIEGADHFLHQVYCDKVAEYITEFV